MKQFKQWMLPIGFLLVLVGGTFLFPELARAETPTQDWVDQQLKQLNLDDIQTFWNSVVDQYNGFLPESEQMTFLDFLKSDKQGLFREWTTGAIKYMFHELIINGKLLGTLILLTVLSMILQTIQNAFEHRAVSKVAYAVVYMVLIILTLNSFRVAIDYTTNAVDSMSHFLLALMPLIFAITATSGGATSVAFFHPMIIFLVNTSGWLISTIILPLLFMSALLHIVSTLTEHYKVTQLANLMRNVAIGGLAGFFAIFLGVMSVQGAATAISDGVLVRTAKFVTGNFVPVVGRMFTDAADTVFSASLLVKNTIGIAGLFILVALIAIPAIKVLVLALIYNIASAVLQPLGGGPIIECLGIMAKSMVFIFAALAIVSMMFFLALTIIIASGNLSLMVR
ncbi:stage III sporulation protein AE [Pullulanibacillus sp. KACC 23026]|uniref:stage III sporulation protein AE n=1 Tax=Pullulanibacillus sp. KACC 23026 TaxID=3028315 RepID=UPI0023AFC072|nr:stage III sporulation protein AE [Pullulanibacillus sp. KACC 23026]WEG14310.1 stage III sporulation protein AE [Pullulanibacillus sp. KACC 23026]